MRSYLRSTILKPRNIIRNCFTTSGIAFILTLLVTLYIFAVMQGYAMGSSSTSKTAPIIAKVIVTPTMFPETPTPTTKPAGPKKATALWGGPELWDAVNKKRQELGVNPLGLRTELCTIASLRLNELLDLGKLDGHAGFTKLTENRPELAWIFENYNHTAEFLAQGGSTPQETVAMWENTLGHSKLLKGGEYVWGCIYAQNTIAVAIAAF